jgi:hypothetical protein
MVDAHVAKLQEADCRAIDPTDELRQAGIRCPIATA